MTNESLYDNKVVKDSVRRKKDRRLEYLTICFDYNLFETSLNCEILILNFTLIKSFLIKCENLLNKTVKSI